MTISNVRPSALSERASRVIQMSAFGGKAYIVRTCRHVAYWHLADYRCGATICPLLDKSGQWSAPALNGSVPIEGKADEAATSKNWRRCRASLLPRALPDPCVNLSIHTAPDVQPLAHAASSFTSSTGSSCCQLASVGPWPRLNNAAPSLQPHYRTFITTTGCSAPVLRIGTLVLTVLAA